MFIACCCRHAMCSMATHNCGRIQVPHIQLIVLLQGDQPAAVIPIRVAGHCFASEEFDQTKICSTKIVFNKTQNQSADTHWYRKSIICTRPLALSGDGMYAMQLWLPAMYSTPWSGVATGVVYHECDGGTRKLCILFCFLCYLQLAAVLCLCVCLSFVYVLGAYFEVISLRPGKTRSVINGFLFRVWLTQINMSRIWHDQSNDRTPYNSTVNRFALGWRDILKFGTDISDDCRSFFPNFWWLANVTLKIQSIFGNVRNKSKYSTFHCNARQKIMKMNKIKVVIVQRTVSPNLVAEHQLSSSSMLKAHPMLNKEKKKWHLIIMMSDTADCHDSDMLVLCILCHRQCQPLRLFHLYNSRWSVRVNVCQHSREEEKN